jgi:hypothetical protein
MLEACGGRAGIRRSTSVMTTKMTHPTTPVGEYTNHIVGEESINSAHIPTSPLIVLCATAAG